MASIDSQKGQIGMFLVVLVILFAITIGDGFSFLIHQNKTAPTPAAPGTYIPCAHPITDDATIKSTLSGPPYHVTLTDATSPTRDKLVYDTICMLSNYKYWQFLKNTTITIDLTPGINCYDGHTSQTGPSSFFINIGFCQYNDEGTRFLITHELGHAIQFYNPDIVSKFCSQVYNPNGSSSCSDGDPNAIVLDSVNCRCEYQDAKCSSQPYTSYGAECFSDMVGFFFTYQNAAYSLNGGPIGWDTLKEYPKNYPTYYNFARDNIFVPLIPAFSVPSVTIQPTSTIPTPTEVIQTEDTPTPMP